MAGRGRFYEEVGAIRDVVQNHLLMVTACLATEEPTGGYQAKRVMADLIVMGTHGRRGLPRLVLGSVAEPVVRRAGCPFLVVKGC